MNNVFTVNGLGKMKFIVSLVDFDYPRTFICKKIDKESLELYLFDEFDHDDSSVTWLCVNISLDDADRLNQGLITLESCFFEARGKQKSGYKVISRSGCREAEAESIENVSAFIETNNTYVDEFVENAHGASLLSLVYEKPFVAFILKKGKNADPLIDTTRITSGSNCFKATCNSMPYSIETRSGRFYYSTTHSIVAYYEISDKKLVDDKQEQLSEDFAINTETHEVVKAIHTLLDSNSTEEQIIDAFKGDKKSIEKVEDLIMEIKKNANDNHVEILAVDYSGGSEPVVPTSISIIDKDTATGVKKKTKRVIDIIDMPNNHNVSEEVVIGQFLMIDTTGRKRFRFQRITGSQIVSTISGFANCELNGLTASKDGKKKYIVRIKTDVLKGEFGESKPIYTLLEIVGPVEESEQLELF